MWHSFHLQIHEPYFLHINNNSAAIGFIQQLLEWLSSNARDTYSDARSGYYYTYKIISSPKPKHLQLILGLYSSVCKPNDDTLLILSHCVNVASLPELKGLFIWAMLLVWLCVLVSLGTVLLWSSETNLDAVAVFLGTTVNLGVSCSVSTIIQSTSTSSMQRTGPLSSLPSPSIHRVFYVFRRQTTCDQATHCQTDRLRHWRRRDQSLIWKRNTPTPASKSTNNICFSAIDLVVRVEALRSTFDIRSTQLSWTNWSIPWAAVGLAAMMNLSLFTWVVPT